MEKSGENYMKDKMEKSGAKIMEKMKKKICTKENLKKMKILENKKLQNFKLPQVHCLECLFYERNFL